MTEDFLAALREDDAQKLYDRAPCGYLTTGADGTIRKANETFLRMCGYASAELVGVRRFADLLDVGGRIYHETHFAPLLHMTGTAREIALDLVHRDGYALPVLVNAAAERDESGAVALVRVAVFDATHRREYERELLLAKQRAEESEASAQALARTLQQTLIPPTPPTIPRLDVAAEYRPAGDGAQVGGDFYDVFQVGAADWVVTIGDVCGKGPAAAVVTALARYTLRAAVMEDPSPAAVLSRLNDVMHEYAVDRYCTVSMLRLRESSGGWVGVGSSGGHPLPLLRSFDGSVSAVGRQGTLLGAVRRVALHDAAVRIGPGDALLLYTDGLTEGRRGREFYGDGRVRALLARPVPSAASLVGELLADALEFQSGNPRDDIALVALSCPGSSKS